MAEDMLIIDRKNLVNFVKCRLNSDGGYSFSYPLFGVEFPSSVLETYYALAILSILGEGIPARDRTLAYLKDIQRPDGRYDSPGVAFYAVKSLLLLGEKPEKLAFIEQLRGILREFRIFNEQFGGEFFSADYDTSGSPFKLVYYASKTIAILGLPIKEDLGWLLSPNNDGGFGVGRSEVTATYHALTALSSAGCDLGKLRNTSLFIEKCGAAGGGYSSIPGSIPPYIETTYFAIGALKLLRSKITGKEKHWRFILNFQNNDGGFRRSPYLGISTLCNSYYAIKALSILGDEVG